MSESTCINFEAINNKPLEKKESLFIEFVYGCSLRDLFMLCVSVSKMKYNLPSLHRKQMPLREMMKYLDIKQIKAELCSERGCYM